jgi:hypothetical protein
VPDWTHGAARSDPAMVLVDDGFGDSQVEPVPIFDFVF